MSNDNYHLITTIVCMIGGVSAVVTESTPFAIYVAGLLIAETIDYGGRR